MFVLSAFADEISPDPAEQLAVLAACHVRFIEFRSIHKTNVLAQTDMQLDEFRKQLAGANVGLSAIGSPVGKVPVDQPFAPTEEKLRRALDVAHRFGTANVRVFSFYPPDGAFDGNWSPWRDEICDRMRRLAELAASGEVILVHENEHRIFGDKPDRVEDLLRTVNHPNLRAAYDAANWVYSGYDPVEGWDRTAAYTTHYHVKDWKAGGEHGVLAGTGDGRMDYSVGELVKRDYQGFAVMEPHLRGGGPTGGVTGPDLFPAAVEAFRQVLTRAGGSEG